MSSEGEYKIQFKSNGIYFTDRHGLPLPLQGSGDVALTALLMLCGFLMLVKTHTFIIQLHAMALVLICLDTLHQGRNLAPGFLSYSFVLKRKRFCLLYMLSALPCFYYEPFTMLLDIVPLCIVHAVYVVLCDWWEQHGYIMKRRN